MSLEFNSNRVCMRSINYGKQKTATKTVRSDGNVGRATQTTITMTTALRTSTSREKPFAIKAETQSIWHRLFIACLCSIFLFLVSRFSFLSADGISANALCELNSIRFQGVWISLHQLPITHAKILITSQRWSMYFMHFIVGFLISLSNTQLKDTIWSRLRAPNAHALTPPIHVYWNPPKKHSINWARRYHTYIFGRFSRINFLSVDWWVAKIYIRTGSDRYVCVCLCCTMSRRGKSNDCYGNKFKNKAAAAATATTTTEKILIYAVQHRLYESSS